MNDAPASQEPVARTALPRWLCVAVIVVIGALLYLPGIRWGLPGVESWSQDTIAGRRAIGPVAAWSDGWRGRYPPFHYVVLYGVYRPLLRAWEADGEVSIDRDTGRVLYHKANLDKASTLYLAARYVSVVMGIGAGVGLFLAALVLTGDTLSALFAGLLLMSSGAFAYFAHLGNVDVPSIFWAAWSFYFFARLVQRRSLLDAALLGLLGSLAISTKDGVGGIYPGMAVALVVMEYLRSRNAVADVAGSRALSTEETEGTDAGFSGFAPRLVGAMFRWRWLVGLACFALPYMYLNGLFDDPQPYLRRMEYWLSADADTWHAHQHRYPGLGGLLGVTILQAGAATGWPVLGVLVLGVVAALRDHRRLAWMTITPAVSYFVIVIMKLDFVYARFLFPMLLTLAVPGGVVLAQWWRTGLAARAVLLLAVACPTLAYAGAFPLEMLVDTRYRAEAWFRDNAPPSASVGAFRNDASDRLKAHYLPRVHEMGYRTYPVDMARESFDVPQPEYLVLTSYTYEDFNPAQREVMAQLLTGDLGYEVVADFHPTFLGAPDKVLTLAARGTPTPGKISPDLIILRRKVVRSAAIGVGDRSVDRG